MRCLVALFSVAVLAAPAYAQQAPLASATVFGGVASPVGDTRDAVGTGWNVGVGGTVRVTPDIGVRADYLYGRFGAATSTWDVALGPMLPAFVEVPVRAKSQLHAGSLDLTWGRPLSPRTRGYLMAGPTLFHRRTQITGSGPQGPVTACEPLWLQCSSEPVGFDRALGIKTSNDLGFNIGAGLTFRAGLTAMLTIEARYFHVRGPEFRLADGRAVAASTRFVPISVGLTF